MNTLEQHARDGNLDGVVYELNTPRPGHTKHHNITKGDKAIGLAARNGHVACVKALLTANCVSKDKVYEAMDFAALEGHIETVRFLSGFHDPKGYTTINSRPLYSASCAGHIECVRFLLPLSDPLAHNSSALVGAARNGHAQCVALLVDVSNPRVNSSKPLCEAVKNRHADVVHLLLNKSDLEAAGAVLRNEDLEYLNTQIAVYEKQMIENALETLPPLNAVRRKI